MPKPKIAIYSATGCSACDHAILDVHYQVGSLAKWAELTFWPHVKGDGWSDFDNAEPVDVCFFAGAIRTDEDRQAAVRLRAGSKILVACGACAAAGGLPGLINLSPDTGEETAGPTQTDEAPPLPSTQPRVSGLAGVVAVDYSVPGCPPPLHLVWAAVQALVCLGESPNRISFAASRLPDAVSSAITSGVPVPKGTTFAGEKAVCSSCSRVKEEKKFSRLYRPHELIPDSGRCLLEQGLVCQGLATMEGCGGLCTAVGVACRGCFGKAEAVFDPGAKMVSAISSTFDTTDALEAERIAERFVDLAGTLYRYTVPEQCVLMSAPSKEGSDAIHVR